MALKMPKGSAMKIAGTVSSPNTSASCFDRIPTSVSVAKPMQTQKIANSATPKVKPSPMPSGKY